MNIELTQQEKQLMSEAGRSAHGANILIVLKKYQDHYSSTRTIDKERDANVQIEGRELFCDFVDEITKLMKAQKHRVNPKPVDDYT